MRQPQLKDIFCPMCGAVIPARSVTSPHPEAPEMIQLYSKAWFGLAGPAGSVTTLVAVCSDACVQELLRE